MGTVSVDQAIKNLAGGRSAINVVAEKHFNCGIDRMGIQVSVDTGEDLFEQIGTTMYVPDCVHANSFRNPGLRSL